MVCGRLAAPFPTVMCVSFTRQTLTMRGPSPLCVWLRWRSITSGAWAMSCMRLASNRSTADFDRYIEFSSAIWPLAIAVNAAIALLIAAFAATASRRA